MMRTDNNAPRYKGNNINVKIGLFKDAGRRDGSVGLATTLRAGRLITEIQGI
jgi:hypothetical protein